MPNTLKENAKIDPEVAVEVVEEEMTGLEENQLRRKTNRLLLKLALYSVLVQLLPNRLKQLKKLQWKNKRLNSFLRKKRLSSILLTLQDTKIKNKELLSMRRNLILERIEHQLSIIQITKNRNKNMRTKNKTVTISALLKIKNLYTE